MAEKDASLHTIEAFKQAITRQEGAFNRRASIIMNPPKQMGTKSARRDDTSARIASGVQKHENQNSAPKSEKKDD